MILIPPNSGELKIEIQRSRTMKKVMTFFWRVFGSFFKWYMKRNRYDIANGAFYTMSAFMILALINYYLDIIPNALIIKPLYTLFVIMILVMLFERESKTVKVLTKNAWTRPKELLKNFTNVSYIYGMVYWVVHVEIFIYMLILVLFDIRIPLIPYVIGNVMCYSFFWFTYHLYMNDSLGCIEEKCATIKLKLQLYGAIASSISIIFLFVDFYHFKIMISMLIVVYTWINYIIEYEVQNNKKYCCET